MQGLMNTFPGKVIQKFLEDQAPNWAVLIAWNALFAMFPIVVFAAALLGYALSLFGIASKVVYQNLLNAIPNTDAKVAASDALSHLQNQKGILLIVGFLGLLWGGSALFGTMEQAFAVIYHAKPRDFIPQKLMSFGMVFVFIITAGPVVASSAILLALKNIPQVPTILTNGFAASLIQFVFGVIAGTILFTAIYFVVPNRKQEFVKVLPGAFVAGVLFELVTLLFPLYIALTNSVATYGKTFALFFILMTFFFFIGLITMVGVEVNSVLHPVDVKQPARGETVTAAPKTARDAEERGAPTASPSARGAALAHNGSRGPVRRGVRARTALLMAVGASMVGLLVGRRSAGTD